MKGSFTVVFVLLAVFSGAPSRAQQPLPVSAAHRIGVFYQSSEYRNLQTIMNDFSKRFRDALGAESGVTAVDAPRVYGDTSADIHRNCEKSDVAAFAYPFYRFGLDENTATVIVGFRIIDCYGVPFYAKAQYKTESRMFANRSGEREVTDMGNHLIDVLLADFQSYKNAHAAQWRNLLTYGVAADPPTASSGLFVAVFLNFPKDESKPVTATIDYLRPDGRGAKAGFKEGDQIVSIDGVPVDTKHKTGLQIAEQLEAARTVVVLRDRKEVNVALSSP